MPRRNFQIMDLCSIIINAVWFISQFGLSFSESSTDDDILFLTMRSTKFYELDYGSKLYSVNVDEANDTSKLQLLFEGEQGSQFGSLASNLQNKKVYYTDVFNNFIGVYDIETSSHQSVFKGYSEGITGLSVDWLTSNVYWIDTKLQAIVVSNEDFSKYNLISSTDTSSFGETAVHPFLGILFWSESLTSDSGSEVRIWQMNMDGTEKKQIYSSQSASRIDSLVLDIHQNRLIWLEDKFQIKMCSITNSPTVISIYSSASPQLLDLSLINDSLFFTENGNLTKGTITTGNSLEKIFTLEPDTSLQPSLISISGNSSQPSSTDVYSESPCKHSVCSNLCYPSGSTSFKCACTLGYTLAEDNLTCYSNVVDSGGFMLVVDSRHNTVFQIVMTSPNKINALPLSDPGTPYAVEYDKLHKRVYWSDIASGEIRRSYLNGSLQERVESNVIAYSLSIDHSSRNIYYIDSSKNALMVTSLDLPDFSKTLEANDIRKTLQVYVSSSLRKVFWSESSESTGQIESMTLSGGDRQIAVNDSRMPQNIAMNPQGTLMFWTEADTGNIGWKNLTSGTSGVYSTGIDSSAGNSRQSITYHNDHLYIINSERTSVLRILVKDLQDGVAYRTALDNFGPQFYSLSDVKVFGEEGNVETTLCATNRNGCQQLCIPTGLTETSCFCADHHKITDDGGTCSLLTETDTTAPVFSSCPSTRSVHTAQCSESYIFNYTVPVAADETSAVTITSISPDSSPPITLAVGYHSFVYEAKDESDNVNTCRFYVQVLAITCPSNDYFIPDGAVASEPSCENLWGSTVNVTCSSGKIFQYECTFEKYWSASSVSLCADEVGVTSSPSVVTEPTPSTTIAQVTESEEKHQLIVSMKQRGFYQQPGQGLLYSLDIPDPSNSGKPVLLFSGAKQSEFWALSADYQRKRILYTDYFNNFIGVYHTQDKTHFEQFSGLSFGIDGISVDWLTGNIYWIDTDLQKILVANQDFHYYTEVLTINSLVPANIAVHPFSGTIYWTERGSSESRILMCQMNGDNVTKLHTIADIITIGHITVDVHENRLYWTEEYTNTDGFTASRVRSCDLSNPHTIEEEYQSSSAYMRGIASFKDHLYVADSSGVVSLKKNTTDPAHHYSFRDSNSTLLSYFSFTSKFPVAVAVYGPYAEPNTISTQTSQPCAGNECEHMCLPTGPSTYKCNCSLGYSLSSDGYKCQSNFIEINFVLMVDSQHSKIYQAPIDAPESLLAVPIKSPGRPNAVTYDPKEKKIYWSDLSFSSSKIVRCNLDGTDQENFVEDVKVFGMSIDHASRNMYFIDALTDSVIIAPLDKKGIRKTIKMDGVVRSYEIIVSSTLGKVFWSDWGQLHSTNRSTLYGKINAMPLEGGETELLIKSQNKPDSLALDEQDQILYWVEMETFNIGWMDLRTSLKGIFETGTSTSGSQLVPTKRYISAITYFSGYIYIADAESEYLSRVSESSITSGAATSEAITNYGPSMLYPVHDIGFFPSEQPYEPTACATTANNCDHICLSTTPDEFECQCADHYLKQGNKCIFQNTTDTTPPSFGNTCPADRNLVVGKCMKTVTFNITEPDATDDSGTVSVKPLQSVEFPAQLSIGQHQFYYRAQDLSGNSRVCEFTVTVRELQCRNPITIEHSSVRGESTCGNSYGSLLNVTCASGFVYQFQCESGGLWRPTKDQYCPTTTPSPLPTTTDLVTETTELVKTDPNVQPSTADHVTEGSNVTKFLDIYTSMQILEKSHLKPGKISTNGVGAAVAIIVIAILGIAGLLMYRNRNNIRMFGNLFNTMMIRRVFYRRDEDTVQLNNAMHDSSNASFSSNDVLTARI